MCILRLLISCCCGISLMYAQSAGEMVSACKQIATSKANERLTILPRDFDSGVCWGAFGTLKQSLEALNAGQRQVGSALSVPPDAPRLRLVAAFAEFMKSHPERDQEDFYPVARDALKAAFPCPAGSTRPGR